MSFVPFDELAGGAEQCSEGVRLAGVAMLDASVTPRSAIVIGEGGDPQFNAFANAPSLDGQ